MRGCTTLQYLVHKTPDWKSEPDDQEFELSSHYFLSSLNDFMPTRDEGLHKFMSARHGAKYLIPDTAFLYDSYRKHGGEMVFLEFPRASLTPESYSCSPKIPPP